MTRVTPRTRLLAAVVAVLATVLAVGTSTSSTTAAWQDRAAFTATATAGTWVVAPSETCEVVTTGPAPRVLHTCTITSVTATHEWGVPGPDGFISRGGLQFQVAVSGYTPVAGQQARVTVDLSRVTGTPSRWNWSAGWVDMFHGAVTAWEAPFLTFTSYEYNPSPFGGQFNAP